MHSGAINMYSYWESVVLDLLCSVRFWQSYKSCHYYFMWYIICELCYSCRHRLLLEIRCEMDIWVSFFLFFSSFFKRSANWAYGYLVGHICATVPLHQNQGVLISTYCFTCSFYTSGHQTYIQTVYKKILY